MGEDHVQRSQFLDKINLGIAFSHADAAIEAMELCMQGVLPSNQPERWHSMFLEMRSLQRVQQSLHNSNAIIHRRSWSRFACTGDQM